MLASRGELFDNIRLDEYNFLGSRRCAFVHQSLGGKRMIIATHGIAAMDAIHVAHAIAAGVDEFVSAEKPSRPMFRVQCLAMRSIREA